MTYEPMTYSGNSAALAPRVGAKGGDVAEEIETAEALLNGALEDSFRTPEQRTFDLMVVRVVRALLEGDRRQYTGSASTQVQARPTGGPGPRDPLAVVTPILDRYVVGLA